MMLQLLICHMHVTTYIRSPSIDHNHIHTYMKIYYINIVFSIIFQGFSFHSSKRREGTQGRKNVCMLLCFPLQNAHFQKGMALKNCCHSHGLHITLWHWLRNWESSKFEVYEEGMKKVHFTTKIQGRRKVSNIGVANY